MFATLGEAGLLGLPYDEESAAAASPTRSTCRCSRSSARAGPAVAVAVSVHGLACFPLATFGTPEQQQRWLPEMLGGRLLGAYSLSEPQAGSDAAALTCKAEKVDEGWRVDRHQGLDHQRRGADFYALFARTGRRDRAASRAS